MLGFIRVLREYERGVVFRLGQDPNEAEHVRSFR